MRCTSFPIPHIAVIIVYRDNAKSFLIHLVLLHLFTRFSIHMSDYNPITLILGIMESYYAPNVLALSRLAGCAHVGSVYNNLPSKTLAALPLGRRPSPLQRHCWAVFLNAKGLFTDIYFFRFFKTKT
jgi:hypothetical protein